MQPPRDSAIRGRRRGPPLTVLTLIDGLGTWGGAERFAHDLTLKLGGDRFERIYCVSRFSEDVASEPAAASALQELRDSGVDVLGLARSSPLQLWSWGPLLRALRERPVDVVHAHLFGSNVWGALWTSLARTPVFVAHEQTWSYEGSPVRRFLDRELIARRADAFICVSAEDRRRMIEIERIDPRKIVLVHNAVPASPPSRDRDLRGELGLGATGPVIGTVALLRPQKALDVLVRAAARLRERFPGLRVLIAGEGEERARLEALIGELSLSETVRLLGIRTDVPDLLSLFDVATLCSDYEGTPLALMEFMAAGLPIVATRVGGIPELIDDGVHGLLVDPQAPEELAGSISRLLVDRQEATRLGDRARQRQINEFGLDGAATRIGELYEELYARASTAA